MKGFSGQVRDITGQAYVDYKDVDENGWITDCGLHMKEIGQKIRLRSCKSDAVRQFLFFERVLAEIFSSNLNFLLEFNMKICFNDLF